MKRTTIFGAFLTVLLLGMFTTVVLNATPPDGKALYTDNKCAICHAENGQGNKSMKSVDLAKLDLTDKETANKKDAELAKVIKEGSSASKLKMKPYDKLSDDEIKALVRYIHSLPKSGK